ncbi:phosphoglycerate mutase family protein [Citrus sinensis]|uniref:Phosphoglycerate mutase family protein n=2 Tax=Citrus sinensis TaxID=2711 RepID=A0ACB8KNR0_CITSI|nr:phosphoglycerate mutase family protein [Citrus sinensis]KAH9756051.1 phosphoglycerate mutase family protein [Citrus sinensis]
MVTAQAQFLYSPNNCKILHMVRHGQGVHNVEAEKNIDALLSPELFDSPISALGWQQVADLRNYVHATGLLKRIDLVVTSPLLRTMQTAVGVFGSEGADAGWKSNCPPIVAHELCRDRLMESEEDDMWYPEAREPYEDIEARGIEFLKWLWTRPEKEIAIVSHGVVLQHFLYVLENDSADPSVKTGLCRRFNNCELRSVVVVNKGYVSFSFATNMNQCSEIYPSNYSQKAHPLLN